MRPRREEVGGSGMAFLDTISCGFGAMILLLLISKTGVEEPEAGEADFSDASALISQVFEAEREIKSLGTALQQLALEAVGQGTKTAEQQAAAAAQAEELQKLQAESERLKADSRGLELVKKTLDQASLQADTAEERDLEVGGIPVDSEYVIFLLDTSGSMKVIWDRVLAEMENVPGCPPDGQGIPDHQRQWPTPAGGLQGKMDSRYPAAAAERAGSIAWLDRGLQQQPDRGS